MNDIVLNPFLENVPGCICSPDNIKAMLGIFTDNMQREAYAAVFAFGGLILLGLLALCLYKRNSKYAEYAIDLLYLFGAVYVMATLIIIRYVLL